ncbi:MAG: SGNH/GDSL hydrolase family protein, partial [Lacisediminimonas sp.]|nr:SGNH/GDSL hydrolase family protein [Lacisediminimonas sp.]
CGGSGSDTPASANSTAQAGSNAAPLTSTSAPSTVTQGIDYYGDSTVWGFASGTAGTQVSRPPPVIFAAQLPASARYVVRNEGVSRTTACQLLQGTDGVHPDWQAQMRNSAAKFVIINHAINDQRQDIGESVAAYKVCLLALSQIARQLGKHVIFETPNPTDQSGAGLDQYVTAMREVAASERLSLIDQYAYLLARLNGADVRTLMPDGTHPSDSTYELKALFAAAEFLKLSY